MFIKYTMILGLPILLVRIKDRAAWFTNINGNEYSGFLEVNDESESKVMNKLKEEAQESIKYYLNK